MTFSTPQNEAIDFALSLPGCNLFCLPGFGKTRTALEIMAHNEGRTLVFAPLLVASDVWPREADKWGYDFDMKLLHGKNKNFDDLPDVCLINYEGTPWLWEEIRKHGNPFDHVIYDEISKFKRPGTSRFRKWRHLSQQFSSRIGMTGSPVGNKLHDVWAPQFLVDGGETLHDSFERFKGRWFYEDRETHQLRPFTGADDQIFEAMRPTARAWTNDHIDMPELRHHAIPIELPQKVRAWYDELKKESTIEDIDYVADNKGVIHNKHRQITGGAMKDGDGRVVQLHTAKIEALTKLLDQLSPEPVLLVFEYRHDFAAIQEAVRRRSERIGFIHGGTTDRDDMDTLARWNAGDLDIFAFHPLACSYGLNLQDVGHHIIYYSVPPSLELVQQSTARLWRQGQEEPVVHAHYLAVLDSVDMNTLTEIDRKEDRQDRCFEMLSASA